MAMMPEITDMWRRKWLAHHWPVSKWRDSAAAEQGFTLIELMVALLIGLVLMAGIYTNFILQSRVQTMQSDITERMGDLYLASAIMQAELRTATSMDTTTVDQINYNDVNGNAGQFKYTPTSGVVCWDIPNNATGCQELMRNLSTSTGLQFTPAGTGNQLYTVTLNSSYQDKDRVTQTLGFSFKIWPRN